MVTLQTWNRLIASLAHKCERRQRANWRRVSRKRCYLQRPYPPSLGGINRGVLHRAGLRHQKMGDRNRLHSRRECPGGRRGHPIHRPFIWRPTRISGPRARCPRTNHPWHRHENPARPLTRLRNLGHHALVRRRTIRPLHVRPRACRIRPRWLLATGQRPHTRSTRGVGQPVHLRRPRWPYRRPARGRQRDREDARPLRNRLHLARPRIRP